MCTQKTPEILPYEVMPAAVKPWDPRSGTVARRIIAMIESVFPEAVIEHIGSTAVPGCDGKGVIDLMLIYPSGELERAKQAVDRLGFQRWEAPGAHPDTRPVRIGAVDHDGTRFRIHVHLIAPESEEVEAQRRFRDRLLADPTLVQEYVATKRAIIAQGITYGPAFSDAKSAFIRNARESL